jgi:hypothetical protein
MGQGEVLSDDNIVEQNCKEEIRDVRREPECWL